MKTDNTIHKEVKRRSTFAILFYINRTKVRKDGMCQLLCKVSIDTASAQIGTKVTVDPAIWNAEGRAEGRSRNAVEVNKAIDVLTDQIKGHYKRINNSLGFVTAEMVKNALKGIGQKPLTLLALFREHNEEFLKRVGEDRTKESYESYVRSYNHLEAFVQTKCEKQDVTMRSLNRDFYDKFDLYLRQDCGLAQKTVHEHLYRLKKMTKRAVSQGTLRCDPYDKLHPELPKRKSRHLKLDDLKKIMERQPQKRNLQRVRDWFIFCTFTGLCYADLRRLSESHITQAGDGSRWSHIDRKKTDTPSAIRLLDIPLQIIEKYRSERRGDKVFNTYSRKYMYKLIRRLGEEYGINDLTFHKARHNFGTHITLSLGVPIETVSRMMGHKRIETTQLYAKVTDKKVDEDIKRLRAQAVGSKINLCEEPANKPKRRKTKEAINQ